VKESRISLTTGRVNVLPQAKPHPGESLFVEDTGRDHNRLNAQGLVYAGYHMNRDTDEELGLRTVSVLA